MTAVRLDQIRKDIVAKKAKRTQVVNAPASTDEALSRMAEWVAIEAGRFNQSSAVIPFLRQNGGRCDAMVIHAEGGKIDLGPLLCTMVPDVIKKRFGSALADLDTGDGISSKVRAKELSQLDSDLGKLEQQEEGILVTMEANGQTVNRRPDAAPAAVLEFQS